MPFAKFDVDLRLALEGVPQRGRSDAAALHWAAVLYSAEMLADGKISKAVGLAIAQDLGQRGVATPASQLVKVGLWTATSTGWEITNWRAYHSSRADVQEQRRRDAERKAAKRHGAQLQMAGPVSGEKSGLMSEADKEGDASQARVSRAHARTRAAADTEELQDLEPSPLQDPAAAQPTEAPTEREVRETLARLRGADAKSFDHVWPLAQIVTRDRFAHLAERSAGTNIGNPVGHLIELLRVDQRDRIVAEAEQRAATVNGLEAARKRAERLPIDQALEQVIPTVAHHDDTKFETFLTDFLSTVHDPDERRTLEHRAYELRDHAHSTPTT